MGAQKHRRRSIVLGLAAGLLLVGPGCDNDGGFAEGFRNDDNYRREVFVQPQPHSTDILWVIDTSCSMRDEQEAVATNFPAFIEFFVERDIPFRMGVTQVERQHVSVVPLEAQERHIMRSRYYWRVAAAAAAADAAPPAEPNGE